MKFQKKLISYIEMDVNVNITGEREAFYNYIKETLKKPLFIIDFEAWTNEVFNENNKEKLTKFEQFNFNKIASFPISVRISKINLLDRKKDFSYFKAFMNDKRNFEVIWNEYILDNYDGEQVVLWGGEIEKHFFLHMVPYTHQRNLKKLKSFFDFFDFQDIFNSTIFLDRIALIDVKKTKQKNSSRTIMVIKEIISSILEETEMSSVAFKHRRKEKEFYRVDTYFNRNLKSKTISQEIEKNLEIYSKEEMESFVYIIEHFETFVKKMTSE